MKPLNCIIIDDEPRAIEIMESYVSQLDSLYLMQTFRNPLKAFDFLKQNKVELIFLDINMPNVSGIQFLKSMPSPPLTILTTAYSEYAVESYQLNVVDYLLKPIEFDRFLQSINKVLDLLNPSRSDSIHKTTSTTPAKNHIFVKSGAKIERVDFNDILYIEGSGNYISYQLKNRKILSLGKMSEVLNVLPIERFIRIHKSYIVQIDKINSIENNQVEIDGSRLSISQTYKSDFYHRIKTIEE